jgi:hypothetical protein
MPILRPRRAFVIQITLKMIKWLKSGRETYGNRQKLGTEHDPTEPPCKYMKSG